MNERNEYLLNLSEEEKKQEIAVEPVKGNIPELLYFNDIVSSKENWVNSAVANFFDIKSIRLEVRQEKQSVD